MMPIFFHLESHLWIAYLFFLNGLLIHWLSRSYSSRYFELTKPFEAHVLAAFFISLLLNALLLLLLDLWAKPFSTMVMLLPTLSGVLFSLVVLRLIQCSSEKLFYFEFQWLNIVFYLVVFVVLFYNGGLIDQVSDAWWHMSLANKIALNNTFDLGFTHLHGNPSRYYPPLWHGNLALTQMFGENSLAVMWNSVTAWGAVLKVMAFYLFSCALTGSRGVGLLSAFLFTMLPGSGDSYLRVSAWPSHISYTAWFSLFFVGFSFLDKILLENISARKLLSSIVNQSAVLVCALLLLVIMFYSHQLEVLFTFFAFLFYSIGMAVNSVRKYRSRAVIEPADWFAKIIGKILIGSSLIVCVWFVIRDWGEISSHKDLILAYMLPLCVLIPAFCILLLRRDTFDRTKIITNRWLIYIPGLLLIASLDTRHLLSLFAPELAYPSGLYHYVPLQAEGWFKTSLDVPSWQLQLRSGLLYSGIIAVPVSFALAWVKPCRATIFLASNACIAFLMCASPYIYHWFRSVSDYHSTWRVIMLLFHPIVFAVLFREAWGAAVGGRKL